MADHLFCVRTPAAVVSLSTLLLTSLLGQQSCQQDVDGDDWTTDEGDCNDTDETVYPGAPELCDGIDNSCDGSIDEETTGSDAACAGLSCLDILHQRTAPADGLYWIDPVGGAPFEAYCDMSNDGGGWTLITSVPNGSTGEHRTQGEVGVLISPFQDSVGKLSDNVINLLRGSDYSSSILRQWMLDGNIDYFRESRPFNALGYTDSINQVYNTYSDAVNLTGVCSGTYNGTYHTGLVGWDCHDYMIYADNPGMRDYNYQAGTVYVRALE